MPTRKQEEEIQEIMQLRQTALAAILAEAAQEMSAVASAEALKVLRRDKYTISTWDGITDEMIAQYKETLLRGGTECVDRVLTREPDGMIRATTRKVFVPWLSDMTAEETKTIIDLIGDAEQAGVHPREIAKDLKTFFEGTRHRAMTAARTEAAKIRNDARSEAMRKNGVRYVQYQTAGDDLVRPEHAMRDGKIYRHEDAPWMGEYNCRCVLSPADYLVEEENATVTESQAEYLTPEEARIE